MKNAAQLDHLIGGQIQLEQAGQLRVAVLLHHINALVRGDELSIACAKG